MINSTDEKKLFDYETSIKILDKINKSNNISSIKVKELPSFANKSIINMSEKNFSKELDLKSSEKNLRNYTDKISLKNSSHISQNKILLTRNNLEYIGLHLLPLVSVGILNGGAATSYTDRLKNRKFNTEIYDYCKSKFDCFRDKYKDSPKGMTPAYINRDGSEGASFIELKMRSFLLKINKYKTTISKEAFN